MSHIKLCAYNDLLSYKFAENTFVLFDRSIWAIFEIFGWFFA